jgi:hypothetical protein
MTFLLEIIKDCDDQSNRFIRSHVHRRNKKTHIPIIIKPIRCSYTNFSY